MSTQANVVLRFFVSGQNSVSGIMDKLSLKKKELTKPTTIPIDAEDNATITIAKVRAEADDLNKKRAEFKIGANDTEGKAKLLAIDMRLEKLNKYLARPGVELQGLDRTLLGIYRINSALDKLNGKTARVNVRTSGGAANKNILSRLLSGSGSGGAFSGPFKGISGVGSGASAGAIEALTSPVGASAAAIALPFLGTGLAGGLLGGLGTGLAGLGILGAVGTGKTKPADVTKAQRAVQQAALQVKAAQLRLSKAQAGTAGRAGTPGKPGSPSSIASAQAALFSAQTRSMTAKQNLAVLKANANTPAQQNLRKQFTNVAQVAKTSLATIGKPFVPVMAAIVKTASSSIKKLTPVFAGAEKTISGPFQQVGVILAKSFASPAVIKSVTALAKSFGQFLSAFAPQIPGIINALANGITGMATAFTDHPGMIKGMASILAFVLKLPGFVGSALGSLTRVTSWLTSGLPHAVSIGLDKARGFFISIGHNIETVWNHFWAEIKGNVVWDFIRSTIKVGWAAITLVFKSSIGIIVASWNIFWSVISNVAKVVWTLVKNSIKGIWDVIASIFKVFTDLITFHWTAALNAMKNLGIQIWNLTKGSLSAIWNAIRSIGIAVWNALKGYLIGIWNNMKSAVLSSWNAIRSGVVGIWNGIINTGKSIWNTFFGWLRSGWQGVVNSAKTIWNGIKAAVSAPVKWVVNNVWDRFAGIINTATNFLHLGKPLPVVHMAEGGKLPGYGGGDRIPALLEAGETVVDKKRSKMFSSIFKWMGVPGYATGGVVGGSPPINLHTGVSRNVGAGPGIGDILNVGKHLVQGAVLGVVKPIVNGALGLLSNLPGGSTPFGKMISQFPRMIANKFFDWIAGKDKKALKAMGGFSSVPARSGSARAAQAFAAAHLAQFGWGPGQMPPLISLWNKESGWNANAVNPSSGAYGIPQSLGHGHPYNLGDYANQVLWGLNYIKGRYGSPAAAWAHEVANNWYAKGTSGAARGWAWVGEKGPELVHFNGGEQVVANHNIGGYARGTAEINTGISLYLAYMHGDLLTVAKLQSEQRTYLRAISRYYNGSSVAWRDRMVNRQTTAMESAASKLKNLEKNFKNAQSYASSVTSSLSGFAGLSNIDITTPGPGGGNPGIYGGLSAKLRQLKSFARALTNLRKKGVSAAIIRQIVDMGPEQGLPYANELNSATGGSIRSINSLESQISSVSSAVGRSAAYAVYGINIAKGVTSQEKHLKALMRRLGKTLGEEAAHWFRVPRSKLPRGYALGTSSATRGWHIVGENGPELLFFNGGERVVPAGKIRGGDGASAPITINVNVSPTPLARPADIGREVVNAIKQFEKGSGTSWRS